jgi:hypothetical protein
MRSDRQRFLNVLATPGTVLGRETRVYSDHLTTSTCSLVGQDVQKRTPRSIQHTLCQFRAYQSAHVQVFDHIKSRNASGVLGSSRSSG